MGALFTYRPTVHLRYALSEDGKDVGDDEEEDERAEQRRCAGTNDAARPRVTSHLTTVEKLINAHLCIQGVFRVFKGCLEGV